MTTRYLGRLLPAAVLLGLVAACTHRPAPPAAQPHYTLGRPYQSGGVWWYPRETQDLDETGLAAVYPDDHPPLTSDGEAFSQDALAAAQPTVQLPAIARLTDLQTGRSVLVRINDRGTPSPHRLVQVTRRVATLLGFTPGVPAQVRLTLRPAASAAAQDHAIGAPRLAIAAAPQAGVQQAALAPPPGARQESGHAVAINHAAASSAAPPRVRLDGTVTQGMPHPGRLWVRLDRFQSYQYAAVQRARVIGLHPRIDAVPDGRSESFRVTLGPFKDVAAADSALDQAIAAGVSDARIVVE